MRPDHGCLGRYQLSKGEPHVQNTRVEMIETPTYPTLCWVRLPAVRPGHLGRRLAECCAMTTEQAIAYALSQ